MTASFEILLVEDTPSDIRLTQEALKTTPMACADEVEKAFDKIKEEHGGEKRFYVNIGATPDQADQIRNDIAINLRVEKMIDSWVASEILYREGKALGVDRGDDMIRDRVAFKMQLLIFDQVRVAEPTEGQLRAWFADNHVRFDEQERVGFYLTPPTDQATARRQLDDIVQQHESEELQNQTRAILGRPVASLAASFGEDFRDALLAMPEGQWNVLQSKEGWHVVRLDSRRPGALASFESVQDEAAKIWHTEETRKLAWEAVKRLKTSYQVRYEQ